MTSRTTYKIKRAPAAVVSLFYFVVHKLYYNKDKPAAEPYVVLPSKDALCSTPAGRPPPPSRPAVELDGETRGAISTNFLLNMHMYY
jgi:hypothetical protein